MYRISMQLFAIGVIVVIAFGVAPEAVAAARAAQNREQALAGSWVVNEDLSDELRPQPGGRDGDGDRRGPGGFGGPGWGPGGGFGGRGGFGGGRGGFGGGRGGFGGGGGDPQQMARMRATMQEAMRDLMTAPRRMTIAAGEREIVLTYGDRRVVRLIPDDREHSGLAGTSARVTRKTRWRGAALEAEIELQSRMELRVRQTYEVRITEGGYRQLIVTTRIDGGRRGRDRELRRVYDVELR
ncbi:MAG: hypothetical protein OXG04_05910 [Acidobacteria bacterium]|nr:hypothetical protein [Acidobacteriota bacterium]